MVAWIYYGNVDLHNDLEIYYGCIVTIIPVHI